MKIEELLSKPGWVRMNDIYGSSMRRRSDTKSSSVMMKLSSLRRDILTQDDFLMELNAKCHIVYDTNERANRPKFKFNPETQVNDFDGYDEVTRVSVSWQKAIADKKVSCCFGNAISIANEGDEKFGPMVTEVKSKLNTMNIRACLAEAGDSLFKTGDFGLYFFMDGDEINYKVYSYEPSSGGGGSNCTERPDYEYPEKTMGVRYFTSNEKPAIELYREKTIEFYVKPTGATDENLKAEYGAITNKITDDGYVLVKKTRHGLPVNPFVYFRIDDVPWGKAQDSIEYWETLISDCGENVKYYAYQILFLKGMAMSLPEATMGGKVIANPDGKGDAKMIEPADASDTLGIALKTAFNSITDASNSVFVRIDELKGQNDSGAYLRNLYHPEIEYANSFYAKFNKTTRKILKITSAITGMIMRAPTDYANLEISYLYEPFVPKNDYEDSRILNESKVAGTVSIKTAAESHPRAHPREVERLDAQVEKDENQIIEDYRAAQAAVVDEEKEED